MLRIYLLGPFRVEHNGQPIPPQEWARPKDRSLLKVLALERGHMVPQDRLLDLLWPDLTPAAAANNLHVAVSRLRKVLDPGLPGTTTTSQVIRREEAGYTLPADAPIWTDLEEFRRRVQRLVRRRTHRNSTGGPDLIEGGAAGIRSDATQGQGYSCRLTLADLPARPPHVAGSLPCAISR